MIFLPWILKLWFYNLTRFFKNFARITVVFENHSKCRISGFQIWHFPPIFVPLKVTYLVTLFDCKFFQNLTIFGIFKYIFPTQNATFDLFNFGIFHQFLSFLVTLFDHQLQVFKTRQVDYFWLFLMNFCPLKTSQ